MSEHVVLGAALAPALAATGWRAVRTEHWELLDDEVRQDHEAGVVLVVDARGRLPPGPPPASLRSAEAPVVVVGRRADLRVLTAAVERGAVAALDGDQPLPDLVRALDGLLGDPATWPDRRGLLARLRRRVAHAAALASLTPRELDVLGALMRGMSAADIARADHVALPTVRSHIRAVLDKTGTTSQLAAVARAHAFGAVPAIDAARRHLHDL
ncbi:helix-turn-helix transcriptional regulator [Cellulomonas sp. S1-8]|uniref:helix-turn-helix transcriptional regulator n=1 Tax=Cellulomonas sp. S1-8 TaxID=2904790 RepID=UPI002244BA6E|nr:LuxR C-terminal-related transcriptional regulator [Cellulomonas sp. S1-8]UZN02998.1 LuxR C-terminal-related transcriptional regulator [Cellulomonas sp. S1-8]